MRAETYLAMLKNLILKLMQKQEKMAAAAKADMPEKEAPEKENDL